MESTALHVLSGRVSRLVGVRSPKPARTLNGRGRSAVDSSGSEHLEPLTFVSDTTDPDRKTVRSQDVGKVLRHIPARFIIFQGILKSKTGLVMHSGRISPGVVLNLRNLVEYGDDAIVSRILVKSHAGNVTLFAFDAGQELSEHTTPFDALVQIVDGSGCFVVAGDEHTVDVGGAILLPANVPHAVKASSRFKMILTMLR